MSQTDVLWKYQELDLAVDRFEGKTRNSAARQRLMKLRSFLVDQQSAMQKIENEIGRYQASIKALSEEHESLAGAVEDGTVVVSESKVRDIERIRAMTTDAEQIFSQLGSVEHDIMRVIKEIAAMEKQYRETRAKAVTAKKEFDALKATLDEELQSTSGELDKLKADRDKVEVPSELMEAYKRAKQHVSPPLAVLVGDQCGGCNMSLPSVVTKKVQAQKAIVECENCGRILCLDKPADA